MSALQFRLILAAYALIQVVLHIAPTSPDQNIVRSHVFSRPGTFVLPVTAVMIAIFTLGLVGFIGMFVFWQPAPLLFACAIGGKICGGLLLPVRNPRPSWLVTLGEVELFLDGFIVALTLLGPAKSLFL